MKIPVLKIAKTLTKRTITFIVLLFIFILPATAQVSPPNLNNSKKNGAVYFSGSISYVLKIDTTDLSGYNVEMHIYNAPSVFQVAMATHHEYDDRFWRYVENLRVETDSGKAFGFVRQDSALWQISASGKNTVIKYRVHLPVKKNAQRASHRPFLTSYGGLVGDIHSFMYLVGQINTPLHVTFEIPSTWQIATGLEPTNDKNTFFAPNAEFLLDCPVLVGRLMDWHFSVEGVPYSIVYWPSSRASQFDTTLLKKTIKLIAQQAVNLFGTVPYRDYTFLLQNGAFGALEHTNSVTIGAPDSLLAFNMVELNEEIAHEFFHAWNLMRTKPVEYSDLNYGPKEQSSGLWWSEGLTMFYADLLLRRAGLPANEPDRISHLEQLIQRYFASPCNTSFSPEQVSLASNKPIGSLGDYSPSVHLQGELIGAMLDLIIRGNTEGQSSIDDVMRKMFASFSTRGFSGNDIEHLVTDVCKCNVDDFFKDHVHGNKTIDFNKYLKIIGLHLSLSSIDALNVDGSPAPDLRVYSWQAGDGTVRLGIMDPLSCWGKVGLHTNDQIITLNSSTIRNAGEFRKILSGLHVGDKVTVEIHRPDGKWQTSFTITNYKQPRPVIGKIKEITALQGKLFDQWVSGAN